MSPPLAKAVSAIPKGHPMPDDPLAKCLPMFDLGAEDQEIRLREHDWTPPAAADSSTLTCHDWTQILNLLTALEASAIHDLEDLEEALEAALEDTPGSRWLH